MRYTRILPIVTLALSALTASTAFAQGESCSAGSDDIRVAALSGLMQAESDQVVPVLRKILERRDACSITLRRQVVGYLSRSRLGDQTDLVLGVARNDPSIEVRRTAVQSLAQSNSDRSLAALDSIVFTSGDMELRDAALRALAQQTANGARASVRRAATQMSMPIELRLRAISYVGTTRRSQPDDTAFLIDLFNNATQADVREAAVRALGNQRTSEAANVLLGVAKDTKRDIELRRAALSALGQSLRPFEGGTSSAFDINAMLGLYDTFAGQIEMQDRALDMIAQRPETAATDKLLQIARSESNVDLRRKAIVRVGQRRDPRVRDFLMEVLNK